MANMFTSGRKSEFFHKVSQRDVVDRQQFLTLARRYFSACIYRGSHKFVLVNMQYFFFLLIQRNAQSNFVWSISP